MLVASCLVHGAVLQLLRWQRRHLAQKSSTLLGGWLTLLALLVQAVCLGQGAQVPVLGFCALVVCLMTLLTGVRHAAAMAATSAAAITALAWAQYSGAWPQAPAADLGATLQALATHLLLLAAGLAAGLRMLRVTQHSLRTAAEREERFRAMLRMSADWYWEQDAQFRFTHIADPEQRGARILPGFRVGSTPWDLEGAGLTEDELDAHLADLDARRPFRGTLAGHRDAHGQWRYASLSGEPRFDAQGVFRGYWGVGRDVTRRVLAQRAVEASEQRYRELFERSPSPLVLHRGGVVHDANAASARPAVPRW